MSVNSKMTAIADAIRAKTGGTGLLTLDDMAQDIAAIDTSEDLDEVLTQQESLIDQIQAALEGKAAASVETCTVSLSYSGSATTVYSTVECTRMIGGELVAESVSIDSQTGSISELLCGSIILIKFTGDIAETTQSVSNGVILESYLYGSPYLVVRVSTSPDSITNIVITAVGGGGGAGGQ